MIRLRAFISLVAMGALSSCATGPVVTFSAVDAQSARSLIQPGMTVEIRRASDPAPRRMQVTAEDATGFVSRSGARVDFDDVRAVTILPHRMSPGQIAAAIALAPFLLPCAAKHADCFK